LGFGFFLVGRGDVLAVSRVGLMVSLKRKARVS